MAPFQSYPETKTFAEVVAGTLKATAKPSIKASISGNSGSIEFEPTNNQKRKTFAEVVAAIKGLSLTEDIKSMSPPRTANPVIEEPKQTAVMISHKLPGDVAANDPLAGDTPNAESNHIRQPTSDMAAEEAKSRSEHSISVFSVSKEADVDEQDFILQHNPANWKFRLDTSPQDSTSQASPSLLQPYWTPKSSEAFANTVDPALESVEIYHSVPQVEFTSGKGRAETSVVPTPVPYTITWSTVRHDGVHIAQRIQGKIVAITMNEFIQTPSGRTWSPRSKRYGIQRDGKFLGSELPDRSKGLIRITWEIAGLAGRVHVFTVLALPDVSLVILDNLDADGTANFRCHGLGPLPESLDGLILVSREEPIENWPRSRTKPDKFVLGQSNNVDRVRFYSNWRAQSYDGNSLYHAVHGPIKLSQTASISRNRIEWKEYRAIMKGEKTDDASDAGRAIAWEALDGAGHLHRFIVTAAPCVEVAISKVEECLHAVGEISIANEVSSEVCGERQKLMPCGLKGAGNTTFPNDSGAQSGSKSANSQSSSPESNSAKTVVIGDGAILQSRNTMFPPSSSQGLAPREQNGEEKNGAAAARAKFPWPNQGSGFPDDNNPDPTNPKKRKLTWPPRSRTGSHWSRDHQQNKQRHQEQQMRFQEQQMRFQEQQMRFQEQQTRFQEQMRVQEQQRIAMVQVQRTQPQQMRDFHPARVQQVGNRYVHHDLQLNFN